MGVGFGPWDCARREAKRVLNRLLMLRYLCSLNTRTYRPSLGPMERVVLSLVPECRIEAVLLHKGPEQGRHQKSTHSLGAPPASAGTRIDPWGCSR